MKLTKIPVYLAVILILLGGLTASMVMAQDDDTPDTEINELETDTEAENEEEERDYIIRMLSDPYPPSAGESYLVVTITDKEGNLVEGAEVEIVSQMDHEGAYVYSMQSTDYYEGQYYVFMVWTMAGRYLIDTYVTLPDGEELYDRFEAFAYAVPGDEFLIPESFPSLVHRLENEQDPERVYHIVIPEGTQALLLSGVGDDVIPPDIKLEADGRNILVIENRDIVDHYIGPFYIRSGETIRQVFNRPAIYEGTCSLRQGATVNIIVR